MWRLRVIAPKFRGTLTWAPELGRFIRDGNIFRLRRGSPKVLRQATQMMVDFCELAVTRNRNIVTEKRDTVTPEAVTCLARARGGYALSHGCHSDASRCDCDVTCDIHGGVQ